MSPDASLSNQPVVASLADFDRRSGSLVERLLFNNRLIVVTLCALVTFGLGFCAVHLKLNASFEKSLPIQHPYIVNYLANKSDLQGLGNTVQIAVETTGESIFDKAYLETLKRINDEVYFISGVDRAAMKSLWTPNMRWTGVTEDGLEGGQVIPDHYDGSVSSLAEVRANVEKSGQIGQIVAGNYKSSIILLPLIDGNPRTGKYIDYRDFSAEIERIRTKYSSDRIHIHITGFAKVAGDLIDGLQQVLAFFAVSIALTMAILFWYTRCVRSALLVVACSLVAVAWQLGLVWLLDYELNPYSTLVPFLVFAIGMSHGAQKMNGIMQDIGRGTHRLIAARYTFRRLFMAGFAALLCDTVGFAVLAVIPIPVIRELAIVASIGVGMLLFTNLLLLPVLLSYTGVDRKAAARSLRTEEAAAYDADPWFWRLLDRFTQPRVALATIVAALVLGGLGMVVSSNLKIGDLDHGAPELRPNSRYNRDNAFLNANYQTTSDVLVAMVKTPDHACIHYDVLATVNLLEWQLQELPGVIDTNSMATLSTHMTSVMNEGSLKWYQLIANQGTLNAITTVAPRELFNQPCNLLPIFVYLRDHKAETLDAVVKKIETFSTKHSGPGMTILLGAGSGGFEAATNIVVGRAMHEMLLWIYGSVVILCFFVFRSVRAVIAAVLPLALTSILCEAIMVWLNMGVKVATLPVIALGVGIGVDYALYILAVMLARLREGNSVSEAYRHARLFTGKVVMLTGLTLAAGVASWAFSPIKFQADMGILLAFMFLWNMIGALLLLPALSHFLMRGAAASGRQWDAAQYLRSKFKPV